MSINPKNTFGETGKNFIFFILSVFAFTVFFASLGVVARLAWTLFLFGWRVW